MADIFDKDVEALLRDKIAYHREQARLHVKWATETKQKLSLLTGAASYTPVDEVAEDEKVTKMPLNENYSVTIWKPLVERVLRQSDTPLKNEDILRKIDSRYFEDDEKRKKAIAVISSSLFSLVQLKRVSKIESSGKGYLYSIAV